MLSIDLFNAMMQQPYDPTNLRNILHLVLADAAVDAHCAGRIDYDHLGRYVAKYIDDIIAWRPR